MGPVPEQVLPGTSTGPLNKVNTLNPQPFTLGVAGRFGGGTPRPPGQEDPDPSPQRVQDPPLTPPPPDGPLPPTPLVWGP